MTPSSTPTGHEGKDPVAMPDSAETVHEYIENIDVALCQNCGWGIYKKHGRWVHCGDDERRCQP